ncbi:MAG TPA: 3-deoxy-manno-octulosonate cytidylyltransferase, partial [Gemmatimonadales bacterium]|nr:3-deoxy-manno-octulosonate cytidylyltransferase [Gemmatimonadales bacterium]
MRVLGVIPARLGSTRLPNKPLQPLAGEPLITRVIERVLDHGLVGQLVVATDSEKVARVAEASGIRAVLTSASHATGTERVAEVAERAEFAGFDTIVNIQGDEPFLSREALAGALARVEQGDEIGTAAAPLDFALAGDPSRVKVVTDARGRALYFSRALIPYLREPGDPSDGLYWQHIGIYACSRTVLARWVSLPPSPAEQAERLEQ